MIPNSAASGDKTRAASMCLATIFNATSKIVVVSVTVIGAFGRSLDTGRDSESTSISAFACTFVLAGVAAVARRADLIDTGGLTGLTS